MAVAASTAGVTGHVSGTRFSGITAFGSLERKSTATSPSGRPAAGTGSHSAAGRVLSTTRAKPESSKGVPPRVTVMRAGAGHAFATKTAWQGGSAGG
ncbi:MAG: hypothetical protein M5U28_40400 [Sandaracinaceae bacterium]|nr:hypothetical protein [Sandaracinaceae bacterium]